MSQVRTRFAPSPTGYFHIGGARTALFSWLYARQHNGAFLLRIEDTDRERSTEESVRIILEGMSWLGLEPDEPVVYQSQNLAAHTAAALALLETGHAYRCYARNEEIAAAREAARQRGVPSWKYTGPDCVIDLAEQERRAGAGEPSVVRFRVPRGEGPIVWQDLVYGEQSVSPDELDDFVLLRADGSPLYMLSVVCDDAQMRVSHVIRGQDHLSNTPKQILLYRALGKPVPTFGHLPLILAGGGEKLSKRKHGDVVSVTTYRDRGFLPDALVNFLALLGWGPGEGDTQEIFTRAELIERFSIERVGRSNARFTFVAGDPKRWTDPKALAICAEWIRTMPLDDLLPHVERALRTAGLWDDRFANERADWFRNTVGLIRERFWTLEDFVTQGAAYFSDRVEYDPAAVAKNLRREPLLADWLPRLAERLEALGSFVPEAIEEEVRAVADEAGLKHGTLINGLRTAVSGQAVGPGAFELCAAIGRERVVARLRAAPALCREEP